MRWLALLLLAGPAFGQGYQPRQRLSPAQVVQQVQDAGVLPVASEDFHVNTLVVHAQAADGGAGVYGVICNQSPCTTKFGAGSQEEFTAEGNEGRFNFGLIHLPTTKLALISGTSGANLPVLADSGKWVYFVPTTDATGCEAGTTGGVRYRSDLGALVVCDGSVIQPVPRVYEDTASVDFPSTSANGTSLATFTLTGALTTDKPTCVFQGTPEAGLMLAVPRVTAANTITLMVHTPAGGGVDPAPIDVACQIVRR